MEKKIAKILRVVAEVLVIIASFLGGQASARNGIVDIFNRYNAEVCEYADMMSQVEVDGVLFDGNLNI